MTEPWYERAARDPVVRALDLVLRRFPFDALPPFLAHLAWDVLVAVQDARFLHYLDDGVSGS
jgi:hypothetical protein